MPNGTAQFKRKYKLEINGVDKERHIISGLRIAFEVTQNLFGAPGLAKITVYNLSNDRVERLRNAFDEIKLSVSYGDNDVVPLHVGRVINVMHYRENETGVTDFYSRDAMVGYIFKTFTKNYTKGTPLLTVVQDLAKVMGVAVKKVGFDSGELLEADEHFNDSCSVVLNHISDAYDKWTIVVNGELFVLSRGKALAKYDSDEVYVINKNTGMLGSPTITEIGAEVTTLLNPDIHPLSVVRIESIAPRTSIIGDFHYRQSESIRKTLGTGVFRVQQVTHVGDTHGNEWESRIVGRDYARGAIEPVSIPKGAFP